MTLHTLERAPIPETPDDTGEHLAERCIEPCPQQEVMRRLGILAAGVCCQQVLLANFEIPTNRSNSQDREAPGWDSFVGEPDNPSSDTTPSLAA